jgi:hypothetical protein
MKKPQKHPISPSSTTQAQRRQPENQHIDSSDTIGKQLAQTDTLLKPTDEASTEERVLQMQRLIGNRATIEHIQRQGIGAKPTTIPQVQRQAAPAIHNRAAKPTIQRLNQGETYYYNQIKRDAEMLTKHAKVRAFIGVVSAYETFVKNNRIAVNKLNNVTAQVQKLYDAAMRFRGYMVFEAQRDIQNSNSDQVMKGTATSLAPKLGESAMEDATKEMTGLQELTTDPRFGELQMTWSQGIFLVRGGVMPSTILGTDDLAEGVDGQEPGNPKNLSGGQMGQVTALDFRDEEGGSKRGVFKPNEMNVGGGEDDIRNSAVTSYRVMAAARVEQLLKAKMLEANREFESLNGNFNYAMIGGKVGTVAEFAPGTDVHQNIFGDDPNKIAPEQGIDLNIDPNDVELQRQMANLQLFDFITGQMDRHMGNVKVQQQVGKKTKVSGIDIDFGFSKSSELGETIGKTAFPILIDRYFGEAVLALGTDEFAGALKGLLSAEIDAAVARLMSIQGTLAEKLNNNELIVAPADKDKFPGARSWADIQGGEYRYSTFSTRPTDYMAEITHKRENAIKGIKANPSVRPELKDGKWVLQYGFDTGYKQFMQARETDGSDLWELIGEALGIQTNFNEMRGRRRDLNKGNRTGLQLGGSRKSQ